MVFNSPVRRGCIGTRTRRRPAPPTCTAASSYDGERGPHLRTSALGTTLPRRGGGGGAVGRTPTQTLMQMPTPTPTKMLTPMRMMRERQEMGEKWARTKNLSV